MKNNYLSCECLVRLSLFKGFMTGHHTAHIHLYANDLKMFQNIAIIFKKLHLVVLCMCFSLASCFQNAQQIFQI